MKRKIVLRLIATVMAAALVVTGVPGTSLTGIATATETVYAGTNATVITTESDSITVYVGNAEADYVAIVPYATYTGDGYTSNTKVQDLTWFAADTTGYCKLTKLSTDGTSKLSPDTAYVILNSAIDSDLSSTSTAIESASYGVTGGSGDVKTLKVSLAAADVVLNKDTYTYSAIANSVSPDVASIKVNGTTYTGADITKYFNIGKLQNMSVKDGATFDISLTTAGEAICQAGTTKTVSVKVSALDLKDTSIDAYITNNSDGTKNTIYSSTIYVFAEGVKLTDRDQTYGAGTDAGTDYYVVADNTKEIGGKATITVYGIGNYTGSLSESYTVYKTSACNLTHTITVTPTTTSIDVTYKSATEADTESHTYQYAISTLQAPSSYAWVDGDNSGTYSFTSCNGAALKTGQAYYVWARIKETDTTYASATVAGGKNSTTGYNLASVDLSKASVVLQNSDTNEDIPSAGVYYTGAGSVAEPVVYVNGEKVTAATGTYQVKYAYITYDASGKEVVTYTGTGNDPDGKTKPKNAGKVRVFILPGDSSDYCGSNYVDYNINKLPISAQVTIGADASQAYNGTTAFAAKAAYIKLTAGSVTADSNETSALNTRYGSFVDGLLTFNVANSALGKQKVTSISIDTTKGTAVSADDLANYEITWTNLSELFITIGKNDAVIFENYNTFDAYYGRPNTLPVSNTAKLDMTYSVDSAYTSYISVDEKGVVTVLKYSDRVTPQVKVSVVQENTDEYDSRKTDPVYVTVDLKQAAIIGEASDSYKVSANEYSISARPEETIADILKELGVVLKYQDNETNVANDKTYTKIALDASNTTVVYEAYKNAVLSGVKTETKPTDEGTYAIYLTYTGSDAANLDKISTDKLTTALTLKLVVSKSAKALSDKTSVLGAHISESGYLYSDGNNVVYSNFQEVDGKLYYANEKGLVVKKQIFTVGDKKYYAMSDGTIRQNGKYKIAGGGYVYAYKDGHLLVSASKVVNGKRYVADKSGRLVKAGFSTTKKGYKYYLQNYVAVTDKKFTWENTNTGKVYQFIAGTDSKIQMGNKVVTYNGKKYYVNAKGSVKTSGTVKYNGKTYKVGKSGVLTLKK